METMSGTYTCAACHGTFTKGWSDQSAAAEAQTAFTPGELEDPALICEFCWQAMRATMPDFDRRYQAS